VGGWSLVSLHGLVRHLGFESNSIMLFKLKTVCALCRHSSPGNEASTKRLQLGRCSSARSNHAVIAILHIEWMVGPSIVKVDYLRHFLENLFWQKRLTVSKSPPAVACHLERATRPGPTSYKPPDTGSRRVSLQMAATKAAVSRPSSSERRATALT